MKFGPMKKMRAAAAAGKAGSGRAWSTIKKPFASRKWPWIRRGLILSALAVGLWTHMVISIPPGHLGVLYRRFLGGTELGQVYPEGVQVIFPWDRIYLFDVRVHEETHQLTVLSNKGLKVELEVTILYYPVPDRTPELLTTVGLDYPEKLVRPMLMTAVLGTAAAYPVEDFFSPQIIRMRDQILMAMVGDMGRRPVVLDNVIIRSVRVPAELNAAIGDTLVAQQRVMERQFMVRQALERFKAAYVDANAVRMTQSLVNPGLHSNFLRWQGIEATKALADSQNSKVVLFGGADGLPVILNLDQTTGLAAPKDEEAAQAEEIPLHQWLATVSPERLDRLAAEINKHILEKPQENP